MIKSMNIVSKWIVDFYRCLLKAGFVLLSIILTLCSGLVYANPKGGVVVSGNATISSEGNRMDINQGSNRAVINWEDFSIGSNEQVNFNQPGKSAVALNRVVGANISNIRGQLTANGNVFIVNRNGVFFGANSRVDVNGLMATTSDISNDDFMVGRMNFTAPGGAVGSIVNEGTITVAEGGLVAFVAPHVRNSGIINARLGKVELAAGERFTLDMYGDDLIKVAVSDDLARQLVENSGQINADGGIVSLTASQAKSAVDDVINMSGSIQAKSVSKRDGKIILSGGEGGVLVAGTLDSSSDIGVGGDIEVLGSEISLSEAARLNASGSGGGGEIHIGGDFQGKGTRVRAQETQIKQGAQVLADATAKGDGGRIIVWSDDHTTVDGSLGARGGKDGGDGGLIETSSAGKLDFSQQVKVEARGLGLPGTWLLDPEDITIGSGQANAISSTLNNGGSVSIKTADQGSGEGNIKVNAPITKTEGGDASLSMQAHNAIDVNAPITSTSGKLNVSLMAGRSINVNAKVSTNGGGFSTSITGVKPTAPEEEKTDEAITEETEPDDELTDQVADAIEDPQTDEPEDSTASHDEESSSPESGIVDATEHPSSDEESIADQEDDKATQEVIDQVQTTVATTEVTVNPPVEVTVPTPEITSTIPSKVSTSPRPVKVDPMPVVVVTNSQSPSTPPTIEQPKVAQPNIGQPLAKQSLGVTINETVNSGGGSIAIDAGNEGTATINSDLNSSNKKTGEMGGEIEILGRKVVLTNKANLDASGDVGGGDIKVGGAFQGKGETRTAQTTIVEKGVSIKSNAINKGNGGEVVVWADKTTDFQGHIEAKGGAQGGDGGSTEVSGKQNLIFNGTVDTSAAKGKTGTLLLDPTDLMITNTGSATNTVNVLDIATINSLGVNNSVNIQVTEDIVFARFDNGAIIPKDVAVTLAQTLGKTVAFKSTNGSIVFANPGDTLATSGANLVFDAGEKLNLGNLKTQGGKVDLNAGGNISLEKIDTRVNPKSVISTDLDPNFERDEVGNDISITSSSGDVVLNNRISTGSRNITINATGGDIIGKNEGIIDTFILNPRINSGSNFPVGSLVVQSGRAGSVSLNAKNIDFSQINLQELMKLKPLEYSIGDGSGNVTLKHVNFGQLNLTTSNSLGETIKFDYLYEDSKNDGFSIKGSFKTIGDNKPEVFPGDQVTINLAGMSMPFIIENFDEFTGVFDSSLEILTISGHAPAGVGSINPQVEINPGNPSTSNISCPPCIVEDPSLSPVIASVTPDNVDDPELTLVLPPLQPAITVINPIASSGEIDRDIDRRIVIPETVRIEGVSPEFDDECAVYDALNWLASGPRDATSSADLGLGIGRSNQSDIRRAAECLNLNNQASL